MLTTSLRPVYLQHREIHSSMYLYQARSQGGGGSDDPPPPPVAHPKDFVPPFSNFVPPFSNFVPPFSNCVPPLEYVDDVTRAMSRGGGACECPRGGCFPIFRMADDVTRTMSKGGACECPRVGAFFKLMTSRGQCPRGGGCTWCSTHPSSDPPPPPHTWLAGYGPVSDLQSP